MPSPFPYDGAHYADYIYNEKPEPELPPEQAAWAQQFLPQS